MILNTGITNAINLLRGDATGKKIAKIAVGTGSADVTANDVSLTGQVAKDITSTTILAGGYLQFNAELDASDPAMLIQEMGLLNADGVLVYRQLITPTNKVAGATYSLNYKIRVQ